METKLQELTDKVYKEGVEKAQKEAEAILNAAQQKADAIIADAQQQAAQIAQKAAQNAEETRRNAASEVKLASTQAIGALKASIENAVTLKVVDAPVKETFADQDYVAQLIKTAVEGFAAKGQTDLKVILPEADLKALSQRVKKSLSAELAKGLDFEAGNVKSGFRVSPRDGGFFISFTEEDFRNFFRAYVRQSSAQMLFDK